MDGWRGRACINPRILLEPPPLMADLGVLKGNNSDADDVVQQTLSLTFNHVRSKLMSTFVSLLNFQSCSQLFLSFFLVKKELMGGNLKIGVLKYRLGAATSITTTSVCWTRVQCHTYRMLKVKQL